MQYNLANPLDRERFKARAKALLEKGVSVELTEKSFRTTSQNAYLHLLLGVIAMETGNTLADAKEYYYKRLINHDLFISEKVDRLGHTVEVVRSSSALTKEEMKVSIDRLKRWGADNGIYLPNPEDEQILHDIAVEMGRLASYM